MTRLRGRAALIDFYHRLASQRPGYIALQVLFCLPLLPAFVADTFEPSAFFGFLMNTLPAIPTTFLFVDVILAILIAWLSILAWQERMWEGLYYAAAKKLLRENSLLLFILEPEYVETLAPLSRYVSQAAGEQRLASDVLSRVRHFLRHFSRYQLALFIWREKYAPQPDWRTSLWLFAKLAGLAVATLFLFFVLIGAGASLLPFLAVFPLAGLILLRRQARNIALSRAVFEKLTGGFNEHVG